MGDGSKRNEPCWCGSGKKYKHCHLGREKEPALPLSAISSTMHNAWQHETCLHPQASPSNCNRIVAAHSVQRSRVLDKLVDAENHVLRLWPLFVEDGDTKLELQRIGWRKASTFTGFCAKHDSQTFAPLENSQFTASTEQCFLIGYRALCHEVFQKMGSVQATPAVRRIVDRGMPAWAQRRAQYIHELSSAGVRHGLADRRLQKEKMDHSLLNGSYIGWTRALILFDGPLSVTSTGVITPTKDIFGKPLQELHREEIVEGLMFGMATTARGGGVVFLWANSDPAPRAFVDSLLAVTEANLPGILIQVFFAYCENTFFSGEWWSSLSKDLQERVTSLAKIANPYYDDSLVFPPLPLVPWKITSINVSKD